MFFLFVAPGVCLAFVIVDHRGKWYITIFRCVWFLTFFVCVTNWDMTLVCRTDSPCYSKFCLGVITRLFHLTPALLQERKHRVLILYQSFNIPILELENLFFLLFSPVKTNANVSTQSFTRTQLQRRGLTRNVCDKLYCVVDSHTKSLFGNLESNNQAAIVRYQATWDS